MTSTPELTLRLVAAKVRRQQQIGVAAVSPMTRGATTQRAVSAAYLSGTELHILAQACASPGCEGAASWPDQAEALVDMSSPEPPAGVHSQCPRLIRCNMVYHAHNCSQGHWLCRPAGGSAGAVVPSNALGCAGTCCATAARAPTPCWTGTPPPASCSCAASRCACSASAQGCCARAGAAPLCIPSAWGARLSMPACQLSCAPLPQARAALGMHELAQLVPPCPALHSASSACQEQPKRPAKPAMQPLSYM